MKKINKYCLSLACLLGIGGMAGMALASNKNVFEVKADASTLLSINFKNERSKLSGNFEFDHAMTYGGSGYTGDNYDTGTWDYWDSLTVTYLNPSQSIVSSISFPTLFYKTSTYSQDTFTMNIEVYIGGEKVKTQQINNFDEKNPTGSYFFYKTTGSNVVDGLESYTQNGGSIAFKFISNKTPRAYGFSCDTDPTVLTVYGYASHDVTLNNGSGTGPTSVKMVDGYPLYSLDSIPTIDNGTFAGYYNAATGGTKYYNADGTAALSQGDSTTTLYAHWDMNGTTITLDKQGGTGGDDSTLGVLDQTLPDIAVPSKSGYTFNGYYSQKDGKGIQYYNNQGKSSFVWNSEDTAVTFYASWTIKPEVQNAINKIDQIGTVTYSEDSLAKLNDAQAAYDAVGNTDKAGVSNSATLSDGWSTYNTLKQAGADAVKGLINAIGIVTLEKENDILAARDAYDALTSEQKELVTNYSTLTTAEARLAELKANKAAADVVVAKINAIGEVSYPESKALIDEARAAYDTLENAEQEGFVSNYATLTTAESQYASLRQQGIDNAEALVTALGTITLEKENDIVAARAAYEALTEEQKNKYDGDVLDTLVAAEARLEELKANKAAADVVVAKIDAIGEVSYPGSKALIDEARASYEALENAEQKGFVSNYATLTTAETTYASLRQQGIADAENLVLAIGEVTLEKGEQIKAARAAYEALTEEQKEKYKESILADLVAAEAAFKVLDDQDKANATKALIEAIGTVEYSETCKGKIDAARAAYDALSEEAKALVDNYQKLVDAENLYGKIQNVVSKIDEIGEVNKKQECKDKIDGARAAYESLSEEEKSLLPEHKLAALKAAEDKYAELSKGLAAWAIVLIVIGGLLVACCGCLLVMFLCFPRFVVDHNNKKVVRAIYVKKHHNIVLLLKTNLKFTEVHEADVYKTKEEAERGLE